VSNHGVTREIPPYLWRRIRKFVFRLRGGTRFTHRFYAEELAQALAGQNPKEAVFDHLGLLFYFTVAAQPKLVVELGTRAGASTRALLVAAAHTDAIVLSVDVDDCAGLDLPDRERWRFVRADDIDFGRKGFEKWCREQPLQPSIDVLYVDTSHFYEHTRDEIGAWFPWLAPRAVVMFHDTNMGTGIYPHTDGHIGTGIDNDRGVIHAIEDFMGRSYMESDFFYDLRSDFVISHFPYGSGLTVMQRL
jgi:cephalosporin hydroxylase